MSSRGAQSTELVWILDFKQILLLLLLLLRSGCERRSHVLEVEMSIVFRRCLDANVDLFLSRSSCQCIAIEVLMLMSISRCQGLM